MGWESNESDDVGIVLMMGREGGIWDGTNLGHVKLERASRWVGRSESCLSVVDHCVSMSEL